MSSKTTRRILFVYLVVVHALLTLALWKTDIVPRVLGRLGLRETPVKRSTHAERMIAFHRRSATIVPRGSTIFFGDSMTLGLCANAVLPNSVNYGIGGDTTGGVLGRLDEYTYALKNASAIVIAIGLNDMACRTDDQFIANYTRILELLPDVPILVSSILPLGESMIQKFSAPTSRISQVNSRLRELASVRQNVEYVDNQRHFDTNGDGVLDDTFSDDGVHLNPAGNAVWAKVLRDALQAMSATNLNVE